jgi:hypothetical protein
MMGGVKRSKQTLNAKEAPCLPRKLAMREGDHLQPFGRLRVTYSVGCQCTPFIICSLDFLLTFSTRKK